MTADEMAPDPVLYALLTVDELWVLRTHLVSGWYKQGTVWPALRPLWGETRELLADIHTATIEAQNLANLTARYAPWRVFHSNTGRVWAGRPGSDYGGSGETVDTDTGAAMGELLAARSAS